jgi:hypothetical protein
MTRLFENLYKIEQVGGLYNVVRMYHVPTYKEKVIARFTILELAQDEMEKHLGN